MDEFGVSFSRSTYLDTIAPRRIILATRSPMIPAMTSVPRRPWDFSSVSRNFSGHRLMLEMMLKCDDNCSSFLRLEHTFEVSSQHHVDRQSTVDWISHIHVTRASHVRCQVWRYAASPSSLLFLSSVTSTSIREYALDNKRLLTYLLIKLLCNVCCWPPHR